jgi:voltage-gated potassium channel
VIFLFSGLGSSPAGLDGRFSRYATNRDLTLFHGIITNDSRSVPQKNTMGHTDTINQHRAAWRDKWGEIIFGNETFAGRVFDVILLILILLSVLTVLLETVQGIDHDYRASLRIAEWIFTGLFTVEYIARLANAPRAGRYARSFYGIVDFLAVGPVYLGFLFGVTRSFRVLRSLRLLRVFRILNLTQFVGEAAALRVAIIASARKITVFLFVVLTTVVIVGALMYEIEGERNGFTSIPAAMYWAVVTITTVERTES